MGFNYQKELIKWNQWKKQEEELLKALNVDDNIIKQLYDYDWEMFKTERRIRGIIFPIMIKKKSTQLMIY